MKFNGYKLYRVCDPIQTVLSKTLQFCEGNTINQVIKKNKSGKIRKPYSKVRATILYHCGQFLNWFDRWSLQDVYGEEDFETDDVSTWQEKYDEYSRKVGLKYKRYNILGFRIY